MLRGLVLFLLLITCRGSEKISTFGRHFDHLRPVSNNQMPIPILEEDPDQKYDPSEDDIDNVALRERLGVDYLSLFMSPTYPRDFDDADMTKELSGKVPTDIRKLFKRPGKFRKSRKQWKKILRNKRTIQNWLYQETACPVKYRWKDLGIRFWPRYIKEGYCDSSKSCSIPAGMKCKSSAQTKIVILRWYCQGILKRKFCTWINVHYPVISECQCQC